MKMSLLNNRFPIQLRTVVHLEWKETSVYVPPRPFHALAMRTKGCGIIEIGEQKLTLNPDEILHMPANTPYYADYIGETDMIAIHFDCDFKGTAQVFSIPLHSRFNKCHTLWTEKKDGYHFEATAELYKILAEMSKSKKENEFPKSFSLSIDYMNANFANPALSVDTLIKISNMSDTYFRQLFIKKYGETPVKYINQLRLEYAESLLISGQYTVNEVSFLSGFNDPKYFSRAIKKNYGVSPSKFSVKKGL